MTGASDSTGRRLARRIKRAVDIAGAAVGLAVAAPVMLGVAGLIRVRMGSPVLFRQRRPGLGGEPFVMVKFRTMRTERDRTGALLPDDQRLTTLGEWLRATSVDELPELFNVLRGDMSLVGPRPLLMEYLDRYTPEQRRRHDVLPGVTGWAQVHGRNAISWADKLRLDVWYVDNWSLRLDLRILVRTVAIVLSRRGIGYGDGATMPPFEGAD